MRYDALSYFPNNIILFCMLALVTFSPTLADLIVCFPTGWKLDEIGFWIFVAHYFRPSTWHRLDAQQMMVLCMNG